MLHLTARVGIAFAVPALIMMAGCLFDSAPEQLAGNGITTTSQSSGDSPLVASPLDPESYSSQPVETGLLGDMKMLAGQLYDPPNNWWNIKVNKAPLDPNSDAIIATIRGLESTGGRLHPDFAPDFGIPYCIVDQNTPLVPVSFGVPSESDAGVPGGPAGYPIPIAAASDPRYIENEGRTDGDRHMLIFDKNRRIAFELAYVARSGSQWTARYGAVFKLDTNYRRPEGWTSTDAAGLSVLAGLLRYDEVYGPWPIRHAIRCSIKKTNGHVWPASHTGASDAGAPPLGMRLRLKKSVDISGYPPHMRKIFTAMKTYGLIVADRGGNMYIQGTLDDRWDNGLLNPIFHDFHVTDFEVIQLGWNPQS
jgi:hypothetical protein